MPALLCLACDAWSGGKNATGQHSVASHGLACLTLGLYISTRSKQWHAMAREGEGEECVVFSASKDDDGIHIYIDDDDVGGHDSYSSSDEELAVCCARCHYNRALASRLFVFAFESRGRGFDPRVTYFVFNVLLENSI